MHCPNCGKETAADVKFCRACGMKLDWVAQAVSQHTGIELSDAAEKKGSKSPSGNRFFNTVFFGLALIFMAAIVGVAGEGIWGAKTATVILALLGMFIVAYRFLPAAVRYDREVLRAANKAAGKKEIQKDKPELTLPPGDDFRPVPSVTEGTTRDLQGNKKTKVAR
jgi:zinc-ribbon domain